MVKPRSHPLPIEIFILAGGLSERMGRDKSRLPFGSRTLLQQVKAIALPTGWPVRIVRRDAVPRCGPLGGVLTALQRSRAESVLFLACDMPFVTTGHLLALARSFSRQPRSALALFSGTRRQSGFPFILRRKASLPLIRAQLAQSEFSLHRLAHQLNARFLRPSKNPRRQLLNLNTPAEFARAARHNAGGSATTL